MSTLTNRQRTKNRYRAAMKRGVVDGPGIWCTCPRGKEKQVIGELYDVFDSIAEELWPPSSTPKRAEVSGAQEDMDDGDDDDMDLETQLAEELAAMRKQPQESVKRLKNIFVDTSCLAYMSCRPPIDPVQLTLAYFEEIERTHRARTRNVLRLSPVSVTCIANPVEMASVARKFLPTVFRTDPQVKYRYKIQMRIRNNNKLKSEVLIPEIAKCVPNDLGLVVDLENPEMVILIEIYQAVCGMSVVPHWSKYKRFNVVEYAQSVNRAPGEEAGSTEI